MSRNRRSSVAGEDEYTFRHALVRDVAYEQIPRAQRADKHLAAAEWIESLGRTEDHAEMLAHHYVSALELSRAAGQPIAGIAEKARDVLREAGDRASSLNSFGAAARFYESALAVGVFDDADRADVEFRRARALYLLGETKVRARRSRRPETRSSRPVTPKERQRRTGSWRTSGVTAVVAIASVSTSTARTRS